MRKINTYSARFEIISSKQPEPQPNQNPTKYEKTKLTKVGQLFIE